MIGRYHFYKPGIKKNRTMSVNISCLHCTEYKRSEMVVGYRSDVVS